MSQSRKKPVVTQRSLLIALLAALLVFAAFSWLFPGEPPPDTLVLSATELEVHIIDVGQGDSILLVCEGEAALIDAGTAASADTVIDYLDARGVRSLAFVVATHPHADHIGGLAAVLEAYPTEFVLMPDAVTGTETFWRLMETIERLSLRIQTGAEGTQLSLGGADLFVLSPEADTHFEDELNNASLVLLLEYAQVRVLLTGDAEREVEERLVAHGIDRVDILKAGHHGSRTSSSPSFVAALAPTYAAISCGAGNSYGHPHEQTLDTFAAAGVTVHRTDLHGDIVYYVMEGGLHVQTAR